MKMGWLLFGLGCVAGGAVVIAWQLFWNYMLKDI